MAFSDPIASPASANPYIAGILNGSHWDDPGSAVTTRLAFHIVGNGAAQIMEFNTQNVTSLVNAAEVAAMNKAMQVIAAVCNVTFSAAGTEANADLRFGVVNGTDMAAIAGAGTLGVALTPDAAQPADSCPMVVSRDGYAAPGGVSLVQGGFDFKTYVHEILHTMGLKHTHDTGDTGNAPLPGVTPGAQFGDFGDNNLNQGIWSVMSYNDGFPLGPLGTVDPATQPGFGWEGTPMAFDIAALHLIYGANTTAKTGNDTYTLSAANAAGTFYSCIWDAAGTDLLRHTGTAASTIDLREATLLNAPGGGGFVSSVAGIHGGFTIAKSAVIENASGGAGIDTITGNAGVNDLRGNAGNDVVNAGVRADKLLGGDGDDTLNGEANADIVYGQNGRDTVNGGDGDDTLYGGDEVGAGDILLGGGAGIDWVSGGLGNDVIDGGADNDRYLGGDAGNDTIAGGLGNDRLYGGADTDGLQGQDGNDYIIGGDGIDTENGGAGIDYLYGDGGNDTLDGGIDNDNLRSGLGTDIYNFELANGSDVIFDFVNDLDTLRIDPGFGYANAAAVVASCIQTGNHVRILLPGAGTDIYLWDYLIAGSGNTIANLGDDILIG